MLPPCLCRLRTHVAVGSRVRAAPVPHTRFELALIHVAIVKPLRAATLRLARHIVIALIHAFPNAAFVFDVIYYCQKALLHGGQAVGHRLKEGRHV